MKKFKKTIIGTTAAFSVLQIVNKLVDKLAGSISLIDEGQMIQYYKWKYGKVAYTKTGQGSPVLLIHDIEVGSASYEWKNIIDHLAKDHTVYTMDLIGYGLSDRPALTYVNYLFVKQIRDFIQDVIGEKTEIIASGSSCSLAYMVYEMNDIVTKMTFINPGGFQNINRKPVYVSRLFRLMMNIPVLGTTVYNMIVSRETFRKVLTDKCLYKGGNKEDIHNMIHSYYACSHKKNGKYLAISRFSDYLDVEISNKLKAAENPPIHIIYGEEEEYKILSQKIYAPCNTSITFSTVENSKHFPHYENAQEFMKQLSF